MTPLFEDYIRVINNTLFINKNYINNINIEGGKHTLLRGKFIVIEGLDCSGKTTLQKNLGNLIHINKISRPVLTKEFTNSYIGKYLANLVINGDKKNIDPFILQYLSIVDRFNHYTDPLNGIVEILRDGTDVICDRGFLSNAVYYGIEYYDSPEYIDKLQEIIDLNLQLMEYVLTPDYVFYIDTPIDIIEERLKYRKHHDLFENHDDIEKASKVFKDAIKLYNDSRIVNIRILNGEMDEMELTNQVFMQLR